MIFRLNQNNIEDLQKIDDPFLKRDYLQELGIQRFQESKGKLIVTWATATGKTVLALKIIRKLQQKHSGEIHITVPSDNLKLQWEKQLKDFENVFVFTIHSYIKKEQTEPILLICDECHIGIANEESIAFNKINDSKAKFKLYLSATLKKDQLKYLAKFDLKNEFKIGIEEVILLKLVPPVKIYNVYVPFTDIEKKEYIRIKEREESALNWFSFHGFDKIPQKIPDIKDVDKKEVTKIFYSYMSARAKRIKLVTQSYYKERFVKAILKMLENRKVIIFSTTQKQADLLAKHIPDSLVYHSGLKEEKALKNYTKFITGECQIISSVGKLIAGMDDACTDSILRASFVSTESVTKQSLGRILRIDPSNPNKTGIMINLVIEPWADVIPCDNIWLHIGLRKLDYEFLTLQEFYNIFIPPRQ